MDENIPMPKVPPKINPRPSWDEYFMNITREVAKRSTCMSAQFGAVIVKNGRIVSTGYNGAPRGAKDSFEWGFCLRRHLKIPSGTRYELCRSVHAEQNAIINAARESTSPVDGDLYLYGTKVYQGANTIIDAVPCFICKKMIINAGIKRVIYHTKDSKIKVINVDDNWIREWQENDMIGEMEYKVDYGENESSQLHKETQNLTHH